MGTPANPGFAYSTSTSNIATLKELYTDDAWVMKDLIFNRNPFCAMVDKDEQNVGMGGELLAA